MKSTVIENLTQLFDEKHYAQLYLPPYQRPYCWERSNWECLIHDFLRTVPLDDNSPPATHFLGIVIILPVVREAIQVEPGLVGARINYRQGMLVDGQQRCISLILLAKAVQALLQESINHYTAQIDDKETPLIVDAKITALQLTEFLENPKKGVKGAAKYRVTPGLSDREAFDECMSGLYHTKTCNKDSSEVIKNKVKAFKTHSMVKAYQYFTERLIAFIAEDADMSHEIASSVIHRVQSMVKVANALLNNLRFVVVELDTADIGSATFADINSKGKPLSEMDLIKNMLYMSITHGKTPVQEADKLKMESLIEDISGRAKEYQRDFYTLCAWVFTGTASIAKNRIYPEILEKFEINFNVYFDAFVKLWEWYTSEAYQYSGIFERVTALAEKICAGKFITLSAPLSQSLTHKLQWLKAWAGHEGQARAAQRTMLKLIYEVLFVHDRSVEHFLLSDTAVEILQKKEAKTAWLIGTQSPNTLIQTLQLMYPGHVWGPLIPLKSSVYEGVQTWQSWGVSLDEDFERLSKSIGNWVYIDSDIATEWRQDGFELCDKYHRMDTSQLSYAKDTDFQPANIAALVEEMTKLHSRRFHSMLLEVLEN